MTALTVGDALIAWYKAESARRLERVTWADLMAQADKLEHKLSSDDAATLRLWFESVSGESPRIQRAPI